MQTPVSHGRSDHDRDTTLYEDGFEVAQQSARLCEEETDRPPVSATDSDVKVFPVATTPLHRNTPTHSRDSAA